MTNETAPLRLAKRLQGVSEYYFSRKLREIAELRRAGVQVINLGIGNPDLPPPPAVPAAVLGDMRQSGAHGYQSYRGSERWRRALKRWYADDFGVALAEDELLPLAGSKEGIAHLCLATLDRDSAVMYPDPGYPAYAAAARLAEATAVPYPMPSVGQGADQWVAELEMAASAHDVRLLFVNTPHMPTGQVLSDEQLRALIAFAKTRGILLVSDNAYGYYHPDGPKSLLSLPGAREVAVELNSLSKSHHMPGWRLGVLVGRADAVQAALQVKSNLDSGQWRPLQLGATVALDASDAWHAEQRAVVRERRLFATSVLQQLGCHVPENQHGLFVWAKLPDGQADSERYADLVLDRARVFIPPGTVFGRGGQGFIRMSLCSPLSTIQAAADALSHADLLASRSKDKVATAV